MVTGHRSGRGATRRYVAPVAIDESAVTARVMLALAMLEGEQRVLEARQNDQPDHESALALLAVSERLHAIRWALAGAPGTRITDDLMRTRNP